MAAEGKANQKNMPEENWLSHYNHVRIFLKLFDGLANFPFTANKMNMIISKTLVCTSCLMSCLTT